MGEKSPINIFITYNINITIIMEINTEVGYVLSELNYKDSEVERFDKLVFHLYCIPMHERIELLAALVYMFRHNVYDNREEIENYFAKFDKMLANR